MAALVIITFVLVIPVVAMPAVITPIVPMWSAPVVTAMPPAVPVNGTMMPVLRPIPFPVLDLLDI
jgi:hypothetical protein